MRKNSGQGANKGEEIAEDREQTKGLLSEEAGCFDDTGIDFVPATKHKQPMLDEREQQFGVDLAEDMTGLLGAPFIEGKLLFPEFEEQLNLPA